MEGLAVLAIVLLVYWTPTLVAHNRKVSNTASIAVINLFLGWTLIGWVVALALAYRDPASSAVSATREP